MASSTIIEISLIVIAWLLYGVRKAVRRRDLKELENPVSTKDCYVVELRMLHEAGLQKHLHGSDQFGYLLSQPHEWGTFAQSRWIDNLWQRKDADGILIGEVKFEILKDLRAAELRLRKLQEEGIYEGIASEVFLWATMQPWSRTIEAKDILKLTDNGHLLRHTKVHVNDRFKRDQEAWSVSLHSIVSQPT